MSCGKGRGEGNGASGEKADRKADREADWKHRERLNTGNDFYVCINGEGREKRMQETYGSRKPHIGKAT